MSEEPQMFPPEHGNAAPALIEHDMLCIRCGYNLRMIAADGRCPECGTEASRSVHGDLLSYADPAWVHALRNAVLIMLINTLVRFVLGMTAGLLRAPAATALLGILFEAASVAAMWMLTTPEPRSWMAEQNVTLRQALRLFAVIGFVAQLLLSANAL